MFWSGLSVAPTMSKGDLEGQVIGVIGVIGVIEEVGWASHP